MIQTQLLKADRPYQIISAAGQVGVQVATLIVTEDKMTAEGYQIDTHSHPVVNYAVKDNLTEELKYWNGDPTEEWNYTQRLQPEGAVWNKVEVRDVRVLGLVGANNPKVDFEKFVSLVPSIPSEIPNALAHNAPLWGPKSDIRIRNIKWALERVGIKCHNRSGQLDRDSDDRICIYLGIDPYAGVENLVRVQIRKEDYIYAIPPIDEIAFRCFIGEDPSDFVTTVILCIYELDMLFIHEGDKIRFVYHQTSETKDKWEKLLEQATEQINEAWKNRYHEYVF